MNYNTFIYNFYKNLKDNNINLSKNSLNHQLLQLVTMNEIDYEDAINIHFKIYLEYLKNKENTFLSELFELSKEMQLKDSNTRNIYFLELKEKILNY